MQNDVTFDYLHSLPKRKQYEELLRTRWNYVRYSGLVRKGRRWFCGRNDGLQNHEIVYVMEGIDGEPRLLLDPNTLSDDGRTAVIFSVPSPNGSFVAYAISDGGSDWLELRVRDVSTGKDLPDVVQWVKFSSVSWTEDEKGFFYSRYPEPAQGEMLTGRNRDHALRYHRIRTDQPDDTLVSSHPDNPEWMIAAEVTHGGKWMIVSTRGPSDENLLHAADLGNPLNPDIHSTLIPIVEEFDALHTPIGIVGDTLYVMTTRGAPRWRVVAIDLRNPGGVWRTVVPESESTIADGTIAMDRLILHSMENACSRLLVFDLNGGRTGELSLPTLGTVESLSGRPDDDEVIFGFTSLLHPLTIYRCDIRTGEMTPFGEGSASIDSNDVVVDREWATSRDGTMIPIFTLHRRGIALDGSHRTILTGYGGFAVPQTPAFSVTYLAWVEMGGIFAQACLRGGGEYGEEWHREGTLERKQNVFDDFIASAEHLIARGYTAPEHLAIRGGSNGGLLVGAVMNQRPDLVSCAIPEVGVMDMLRYHLFTIGRAWRRDYGLSEDPEMFPILYAYSPLHNLREGVDYPAVLIMTGDHDDRVVPAHSFKYAARLQACARKGRPALIRVETRAGHGFGRSTSILIEQGADLLAFAHANT